MLDQWLPGANGDPTSATAVGEVCARTTARMEMRGIFLATTMRAARRIAGVKTASPESATAISCWYSRWLFGTAAIPFSKSACSGSSNEGNHGEDAKEYWFHLDSTPTHSYMSMLYKYPQQEYPYRQLIEENRSRGDGSVSSNCWIPASSMTIAISIFLSNMRRHHRKTSASAWKCSTAVATLLSSICCRICGSAIHGVGRTRPAVSPRFSPKQADKHLMLMADDSAAKPLENIQLEYALGRQNLICARRRRVAVY